MLDQNGMCHFGSSSDQLVQDLKKLLLLYQSLSLAMASSTSASSFELVEDLSEEEIALAEMELEGSRAAEAAVRAGLCLEASEAPQKSSGLLGSPQGYL